MKKKVLAILMAVAVVGMYTFGSVASVFAADSSKTTTIKVDDPNVNYSKTKKETTDGSVTVYTATLTYTIPAGTEGDVTIDYSKGVLNSFVGEDYFLAMPGDLLNYKIVIINKSGHDYKYANNSFNIKGGDSMYNTTKKEVTYLSSTQVSTFFNNYLTWSYSDAQQIWTKGKTGTTAVASTGINKYTAGTALYNAANQYFADNMNVKSQETNSNLSTSFYFDFDNIDNQYASSKFGFTGSFTLAQVPDPTTYSVVANYYTSTNGGEYALDGTETKTASADTTVGSEIKVTPEDAWATYNGNTYGYDAAKSTVTKTAVLDSKSNVLTVNYYRTVNTTTTTPTDNNTTNGGTTVDTPSNNNTAAATKTKTGTTAAKADNNNSSAPKTGDTSDLMAWSVLGLAGIVLAGAAVAMRKREE